MATKRLATLALAGAMLLGACGQQPSDIAAPVATAPASNAAVRNLGLYELHIEGGAGKKAHAYVTRVGGAALSAQEVSGLTFTLKSVAVSGTDARSYAAVIGVENRGVSRIAVPTYVPVAVSNYTEAGTYFVQGATKTSDGSTVSASGITIAQAAGGTPLVNVTGITAADFSVPTGTTVESVSSQGWQSNAGLEAEAIQDVTFGFDIPAGNAAYRFSLVFGVFDKATPWINELSYDTAATNDAPEFVEVVVPAGVDTSNLSLVLYNGNGGASYRTDSFSSTIVSTTTVGNHSLYTFNYPVVNGGTLQNGAPDGLALCRGTELVQFISYEGEMVATNGCANGQTSMNIGVAQANTTPAGQSLQLNGSGNKYSDFTWQAPATATPGALNNGQTLN
ncbi:hypothetical protein ACINK0_09715 [Deinococcus sp. VB343]|uniref:hypothetical protein n=1 Tax=Deinococcus sp. VB343 TaxID=3385567 RepID=UPI0039C92410